MATSIVTGGAGFLGSHLVDALVRRRESVVVLDDLTTGRLANLGAAISSGRVTFIYADVNVDAGPLRELVTASGAKRIDYIYHLASPSDAAGSQPAFARDRGTPAVIDLAIEHGARLIYAAWPDRRLALPFGEAAIAAAVAARGLDARVVRFISCYGPRSQATSDRLIPALLEAALDGRPMPIPGTGEQRCTMTYIDDAIDLLLIVASRTARLHEPVNVGLDDERSVIDIAATVARTVGVEFRYEHVGPEIVASELRNAGRGSALELGWRPKTSLEAGLRSTSDWFNRDTRLFV